ncbi:MAG: alpha/beta hydrolase [Gemmatimonadota bacterium]|nr:alpha/beta hydrolase [Gemmatimonadota bacterium]MDH4347921.1 alpha/beta hydrolase [Gemmatimonadota bacterium]MDH5284311.1 alpha/beta hydrolase [Gemmatimonadota bacterium]
MATPVLTRHVLDGVLGPIFTDVRTSDRQRARPAVLVVHGFKGFKDWGMFPLVAERLARAGFTAVSFNLSGSGVDSDGRIAWPDRFGHATYSGDLEDMRRVSAALGDGRLGLAPTSILGVLGHSRGGGEAILFAAEEPTVRTLVTWSAISVVHRWRDQEDGWRRTGQIDIRNARTGDVLPLYPDVLDDIGREGPVLDIRAAAARVKVPWLLVHGTADESVPVAEAEALRHAAASNPALRYLPVDGAGHTFGATHPMFGITPALAVVLDESVKWMGRHL